MKRSDLIYDLTLMLMKLAAWDEGAKRGKKVPRRADALADKEDALFSDEQLMTWKGYDFGTLDALVDDGLISTNHRAKSARITPKGSRRAEELLDKYGIQVDPAPPEQGVKKGDREQ